MLPPTKRTKQTKDGSVSLMFGLQFAEEKDKCKFVVAHARTRQPKGIVCLLEQEKNSLVMINDALAQKKYGVAKTEKARLDKYRRDIAIEEKLLLYCLRLRSRSADRIDYYSKDLNIDEIEHWNKVKDACDKYLPLVPNEDLTHFKSGKMMQPYNCTLLC